MYAERAYFDGDHCQHVADRQEHQRVQRKREECRRAVDRRWRSR